MGPVDFGAPLRVMMVMLAVSVPLGLWKLVEIVVWLVRNVHIGVGP